MLDGLDKSTEKGLAHENQEAKSVKLVFMVWMQQ